MKFDHYLTAYYKTSSALKVSESLRISQSPGYGLFKIR
jgi:hypothetical protein